MADREPTRVVIIGGGIGGVKSAQQLAKLPGMDITIIDRNNYQLFQMLIFQVSTGLLSESEICYPVRNFFRKNPCVRFRLATVTGIDADGHAVITDHGRVPYDFLIVAAGATTNFFGMKDIERHAFPLKTMTETVLLRDHILRCAELADSAADEDERKALLTFVVVGGGPTGVEEVGAISEMLRKTICRDFLKLDLRKLADVKLIEMTDRLLPMVSAKLAGKAMNNMRGNGIDVRLNTAVSGYDGHVVTLKSGEKIPARTLVWAAGVRAVPVVDTLGAQQARDGRVHVNFDLTVKGQPDIYAIGDCAFCVEERGVMPLPTIAPVALQQAQCVAANIEHRRKGEPQQSFVYHDLGAMATVGRFFGVMSAKGFEAAGLFAWIAWLAVHLQRMPGLWSNLTVLYKWVLNVFHVRTNCVTKEPPSARPLAADDICGATAVDASGGAPAIVPPPRRQRLAAR